MRVQPFVEVVGEYTDELATQLGRLMPMLSERLDETALGEESLRPIIYSENRELFVARTQRDSKIVGAGVLNLVYALSHRYAILDDFVVDSGKEYRGQGFGSAIWDEMIKWCEERKVNLDFTSKPTRVEAHKFYFGKGAEIRETSVFRKLIK